MPLSGEELAAIVGEAQASLMKEYIAYDIKIMINGEEWQPDETVSVTVRQNELTAEEGDGFGVAHVDSETNEVTNLDGQISSDGQIELSA